MSEDEPESQAPRGAFEGFWSLDAPTDTPDVMRDCIRDRAWEKPARADFFKLALRLADDLKRRGCPHEKARELILGCWAARVGLFKREEIKGVESAVRWVFEKQEHGITCAGALTRDGWCHRFEKGCHYHDQEQAIHAARRAGQPTGLPEEWLRHLGEAHPTDALYADFAYQEIAAFEAEKNLSPGDDRSPVFIGFRTLAARIRAKHGRPGYDKNAALRSVRLLLDNGLILIAVKGKSCTRLRQANGYVRVLPIPPLPTRTQSIRRSAAISSISPIYNPYVPDLVTHMCPDLLELAGLS